MIIRSVINYILFKDRADDKLCGMEIKNLNIDKTSGIPAPVTTKSNLRMLSLV